MIVKIWPVKGDQGTHSCMLYIQDDEKIVRVEMDETGRMKSREELDTQALYGVDADTFFIEHEEDINRVIHYMANKDKTQSKLVSGYLCDPDVAAEDFRYARMKTLALKGADNVDLQKDTMSFHLVQSFPEELNISDEEVHQCGIELLKKLDKHQGLVCSHVVPVRDEEGEVHGKCKHNHILINAYIHPSKFDPEHPRRVKYNDCIETYKQLQIWNDEIAIDHGLPIILNPDLDKVYSWKESAEVKAGHSWKERMRLDIEAARREANTWEQFVQYMNNEGYTLRDGKYVSYTAPDGKHKARGETLGTPYTRQGLELYWTLRDRSMHALTNTVQENQAPPLLQLAISQDTPLTVNVPLGQSTEGERAYYPLPLVKAQRKREVLNTYFSEHDLYDVKDSSGKVVASATGAEIVECLDMLRRGQDELYRKWQQEMEQTSDQEQKQQWEDIVRQEQEAAEQRQRERYQQRQRQRQYVSKYKNSRTGKPYHTNLYDEKTGRRRTSLELIFLIAMVTIKSEDGLWEVKNPPPDVRTSPNFGPTDWKIQSMIDALYVSEEIGLESPSDVAEKLQEVGAAYSRARAAVNRSQNALDKMKGLAFGLREYEETRAIAERIDALPDGPEKEKMLEQFATEIERYQKARSIMNGYKVNTQDQIRDFWRRYDDITRNLPEMQERYDNLKEEYRKVKTLNYRLTLAQTELFCFGPAYDPERVTNRDQGGRSVTEREFEAHNRDG